MIKYKVWIQTEGENTSIGHMSTWPDKTEEITAESAEVNHQGYLLFYINSYLIAAYAPYDWDRMKRVDIAINRTTQKTDRGIENESEYFQ